MAQLLRAAGAGAVIGVAWALMYTPAVLPVPLIAASYAIGAATLWMFYRAFIGTAGFASLVFGLVAGLGFVPGWMGKVHESGAVSGSLSYCIDLVLVWIVFSATTCAAETWSTNRRCNRVATAILGSMALAITGTLIVAGNHHGAESQPSARRVTESFPDAKVAMIGIDGGDWSIADPLLKEGVLPHLAALIQAGQRGVLRSVEPAFSPVVWTSIFSGMLPEHHGLDSWFRSDARNRKVPMLWDIFGAHGKTSITVNVPGSWPPAEIANGTLLAGFPIPGLVNGTRGALYGRVLSSVAESGIVETMKLVPVGDGRFSFDLPIAIPDVKQRVPNVSNSLIDLAMQRQYLVPSQLRMTGYAAVSGDTVTLGGATIGEQAPTKMGTWSEWVSLPLDDTNALLKFFALDVSDDVLRLYMTPPFQSPDRPRFEFVTGAPADLQIFSEESPYVVEGLGWARYADDRIAKLLPDKIMETERGHQETAKRLLENLAPNLFSYVITVTDRLQHPFWALHEPSAFPANLPKPEGLEHRLPIREAWLLADEVLGSLLERLDEDTLVVITSDHGFKADPDAGNGTHRMEGIWVAAGPDIEPSDAPYELSVLDVVPTILNCIGAPVSTEFDGSVSKRLCTKPHGVVQVDTYLGVGGTYPGKKETSIDASRVDQIRSLGYTE